MSPPPHKISSTSTNQSKSYFGVSLHPFQKFKHQPFWKGWSCRIKNVASRSSSTTSPAYQISLKSTSQFKSYWKGHTDRLVIFKPSNFLMTIGKKANNLYYSLSWTLNMTPLGLRLRICGTSPHSPTHLHVMVIN